METFEEDDPKNIYVNRRNLGLLKRVSGRKYFEYKIGYFTVIIYTYEAPEPPPTDPDNILTHQTVSVVVNEKTKDGISSSIHLREDSRFKDYKPIQYDIIQTPTGSFNLSDGRGMPITHLCELIRYLNRLYNLTAFT